MLTHCTVYSQYTCTVHTLPYMKNITVDDAPTVQCHKTQTTATFQYIKKVIVIAHYFSFICTTRQRSH